MDGWHDSQVASQSFFCELCVVMMKTYNISFLVEKIKGGDKQMNLLVNYYYLLLYTHTTNKKNTTRMTMRDVYYFVMWSIRPIQFHFKKKLHIEFPIVIGKKTLLDGWKDMRV